MRARAERVRGLRGLGDRQEGLWLGELAAVDARGAAGAEEGTQAGSTAGWLRHRLRMGAGAAASAVRTARALFRGPLTATAQALAAGELSPAHAQVLAHGTHDLPDHLAAEAEPVLVEAARRLDPPRLRRVVGHLLAAADPDGAEGQAERRHGRRGLWVASTWEGMVALQGLLEPEAGQILLAALEPLARPADADDDRSGDQRRADALVELARRNLESGQLPQSGGVRPQLLVTVDLDSLLGHPGSLGGEVGAGSRWTPEACRRLACDGAVTRVLVTRHPTSHHHDHRPPTTGHRSPRPPDHQDGPGGEGGADRPGSRRRPGGCPRPWVAAPPNRWRSAAPPGSSPAAQRAALAVRDGGCASPTAAAPGLVRGPSSPPLAAWRPHRPGQSGPALPSPSPGGA